MKFSRSNLKLVCCGANSEVYLYGTSERGVVLKTVKKSDKNQCRHLSNQFSMLKKLNHDNVVKALKYQEGISIHGNNGDKQNQNPRNILILENACHGSLLNFWKKSASIGIRETRWVFSEITEAIKFLHDKKIAHRDLKLENVLIGEDAVRILIKIADFGFASQFPQSPLSKGYKGTKRGYMAPQIHSILANPEKAYDVFKADIFALGVILFSLVLKRLPFEFATQQNLHYGFIVKKDYQSFWKIHSEALNALQMEQGSMVEDFKQIFISMVSFKAEQRPTIQEVIHCSWMKGRQTILKSLKLKNNY